MPNRKKEKPSYEQLEARLKYWKDILTHWKQRALKAENKISQYAFIDKKPDYIYSFSGTLIFRRYCAMQGLDPMDAQALVIMSYFKAVTLKDFKLFAYQRKAFNYAMEKLTQQRYIVKVKIPSLVRGRTKTAFSLTQRGKDFENDYEKFYDDTLNKLINSRVETFNIQDGKYFRKKRKSRKERRAEQGGGSLTTRIPTRERWKDIDEETGYDRATD